jgi:hypothetical protein
MSGCRSRRAGEWPTFSGLVENLSRRFDAHEREKLGVYYPAAAALLTPAERQSLEDAARGC